MAGPKPVKKETPPEPVEAPPPAKGGGGKKLIIILTALLLLGGAGGGAAWYFLRGSTGDAKEEAAKPKAHAPPVFVNLEPFTVNLQAESSGDQFLQLVAVLRVADDHVSERIKTFMPELRHRMLLLLSGKRASEIGSPEGREKLAEEMRNAINGILASESGAGKNQGEKSKKKEKEERAEDLDVQSVFFTSFIVQ